MNASELKPLQLLAAVLEQTGAVTICGEGYVFAEPKNIRIEITKDPSKVSETILIFLAK